MSKLTILVQIIIPEIYHFFLADATFLSYRCVYNLKIKVQESCLSYSTPLEVTFSRPVILEGEEQVN